MTKNTKEKELYLAPEVEVVRLASPISLLETFSGKGNVDDFIDEGEWGLDGSEPDDWFA